MISELHTVPIGALSTLPEKLWQPFIGTAVRLGPNLQEAIFSPRTGAYTRGLIKAHRLPAEAAMKLALIMLYILIGKMPISKLAATISGELQLANDQAQAISRELERDFFAPLALEISQLKERQVEHASNQQESQVKQAGARNVLNLKRKPPTPPQLPRQQ